MRETVGTKTNPKRDYGLDFLKIIATISIFFLHYQQVFSVHFDNHINFYHGYYVWYYVVELFFILSGFVIYKEVYKLQTQDIELDKWIAPRLFRLIPLMAVSVFAYQIADILHAKLIGRTFFFENHFSIFRTVVAALGLQAGGIFQRGNINNPTWYICILLICYLLFYVLTIISKKISCKPYYLYALMVFVGIAISENGLNPAETARGLYSFFFGILLAHYINTFGVKKPEIIYSIFVLLLTAVILVIKPGNDEMDMCFSSTFFVFPAIIILIESPLINRKFAQPIFKTLSDISFNLYIWHLPLFVVINIVHSISGEAFAYDKVISMYLCLAICFLWATFSHFFIERNLKRVVNSIRTYWKLI